MSGNGSGIGLENEKKMGGEVELGCEKVVWRVEMEKNYGSKRTLNQEVEAGSKSRKQKQGQAGRRSRK